MNAMTCNNLVLMERIISMSAVMEFKEFLGERKPRIRPNYTANNTFIGFRIEVYDRNAHEYRAVGINFSQHKLAFLALRAIETGGEPREGVVTRRFERVENRFMRNVSRGLIATGVATMLFGFLGGCSTVRPLAEVQHISHASQHFGNNTTNYGWNLAGVGVRWRPAPGVVVDLLESYSLEEMNSHHEVFTGRVTVEF